MTECTPWLCISGYMLDETLWAEVIAAAPGQTIQPVSLSQGSSLVEMADYLIQSAPDTFVAVGFSLGGYVARTLAARYPHRVAALVLVASSMREDTPDQQEAKRKAVAMQTNVHFRGLGKRAIAKTLSQTHSQNEEWLKRIQHMGMRLGHEVFVRQSLLNRQTPPNQKISCPTLIIGAQDDQLRAYEEACELQKHILQAQIQILAGSGHMLPLEQPQLLVDTIQNWLRQQHINK
ncbi:alpha/beta hydrolase [Neisseriaceae bacterium ESL0693]|nr:alpha/beta hydrolase [Neisseriaceae bacterium ESL0693]